MSMPTPEEWIEFGKVLITWGSYAMLYGAITIVIGLAIVLVFNGQLNKAFHYICKNF